MTIDYSDVDRQRNCRGPCCRPDLHRTTFDDVRTSAKRTKTEKHTPPRARRKHVRRRGDRRQNERRH